MLSGGHPWDQSLLGDGKCVTAARHQERNIKKDCKCQNGFHQRTIGSVTIVLTRLPIDSDFTDIYFQVNL